MAISTIPIALRVVLFMLESSLAFAAASRAILGQALPCRSRPRIESTAPVARARPASGPAAGAATWSDGADDLHEARRAIGIELSRQRVLEGEPLADDGR